MERGVVGSPADRIREARERAGLKEEEVAARVGLVLPLYRDLESDDSEAFMNISLAHLSLLAGILGVPARVLLLGEGAAPSPREPVSFSELSARLARLRGAEGVSVEELGERVGWELRDVLVDPEDFWNFNVDGLRDVCRAVQVDWVAALPD